MINVNLNRKALVIIAVIALSLAFLVGSVIGYKLHGLTYAEPEYKRDTVRIVRTIKPKPIVKDSTIIKYVARYFQVKGDTEIRYDTLRQTDSVQVQIPITQKRYEGDDYKAWVSGYEPKLDSIHINTYTDIVTVREKAPRWNIGVHAGVGYGITSKKIEPFIGIGIGYRILGK